jgi:hypothetical protein
MTYIRTFIAAYEECLLWSSTVWESEDVEPVPADSIDLPLSKQAKANCRADCIGFIRGNRSDLERALALGAWDASQAGHDFALTRNRHGAGFWDRYWNESEEATLGDRLSDASRAYGGTDIWIDGEYLGIE